MQKYKVYSIISAYTILYEAYNTYSVAGISC